MLTLKKKLLQLKNKKKGFTLVEIILVLLILAILAAIAMPAMVGLVDEAEKGEDEGTVQILNAATETYEDYIFTKTGQRYEDVFQAFSDDEQRQQALLARGYIKELMYSSTTGKLFVWNIPNQIWELGDGSSSTVSPKDPNTYTSDGTILDGLLTGDKHGEWKKEDNRNYKFGDLVTVDGVTYKLITEGLGWHTPGFTGNTAWKAITLKWDRKNYYEKGDIVRDGDDGEYYRVIGENKWDYGSSDDKLTNKKLYEKVYQNEDGKTWTNIVPS